MGARLRHGPIASRAVSELCCAGSGALTIAAYRLTSAEPGTRRPVSHLLTVETETCARWATCSRVNPWLRRWSRRSVGSSGCGVRGEGIRGVPSALFCSGPPLTTA